MLILLYLRLSVHFYFNMFKIVLLFCGIKSFIFMSHPLYFRQIYSYTYLTPVNTATNHLFGDIF